MADRGTSQATATRERRLAPVDPPAPLARRSASIPLPPEPLPPGAAGAAPSSAASGPFRRPIGPARGVRPALAGMPLSRAIPRPRTRLERALGGSTVLHVLLLALLALLYARQGRLPTPPDQAPVQMVFGQSGMTGDQPSPDDAGGAPPTKPSPPPAEPAPQPVPAPAPPPQQEPAVNTEIPPALPPVPVPELLPLPPESQPLPPTVVQPQRQTPPERFALRTAPPAPSRSARSSPFSHPMDLSFSQAPGPSRARTGRPGGSHAPIDLSLGPLVRNGHLNSPYATVGIKGVSDDYGSEIDSWIRRHLYYPPEAAERGEDGASRVHVVIDRSGHVKSARLVDSSGAYALDDATTGMFRGATLPPVPDDMSGDHFDIDLTVNYILIR